MRLLKSERSYLSTVVFLLPFCTKSCPGWGIEKRPGTEKGCSHNLLSGNLGQRGIFERALFAIAGLLSGVFEC